MTLQEIKEIFDKVGGLEEAKWKTVPLDPVLVMVLKVESLTRKQEVESEMRGDEEESVMFLMSALRRENRDAVLTSISCSEIDAGPEMPWIVRERRDNCPVSFTWKRRANVVDEVRLIVKLEQVRNPVVIRKTSPFDGPDGWNVTVAEESGLMQTKLLAMVSCEEPR